MSALMSNSWVYSVNSEMGFRFLDLPLELRRKVYGHMRQWPWSEHHAVLQTCKKFHEEAKESIEQRAMLCNSHSELFDKIVSARPINIKVIPRLVLCLDPHAYYASARRPSRMEIAGSPDLPFRMTCTSDPFRCFDCRYCEEVKTITMCLSRLPNLARLELLAYSDWDSDHDVQHYQLVIARWVASSSIPIKHLKLGALISDMACLPYFPGLEKLEVNCNTMTQSRQMPAILQSLKQLESLTITKPLLAGATTRRVKRSFNGHVVRAMNPLKTIKLVDRAMPSTGTLFPYQALIDGDLLMAIRDKHAQTLKHLDIVITHSPANKATSEALVTLIESAVGLESLQLNLLDTTDLPDFTKCSPALRNIRIQIFSKYLPSFYEKDFDLIHETLPNLKEFELTVCEPRMQEYFRDMIVYSHIDALEAAEHERRYRDKQLCHFYMSRSNKTKVYELGQQGEYRWTWSGEW